MKWFGLRRDGDEVGPEGPEGPAGPQGPAGLGVLGPVGCSFAVGTQVADMLPVRVDLFDAEANPMAEACTIKAWVTTDAEGRDLSILPDGLATASDTLALTRGSRTPFHAGLQASVEVLSDDLGQLDLGIVATTPGGWYLHVELPDGRVEHTTLLNHAGA